jgi:hypothetical protein
MLKAFCKSFAHALLAAFLLQNKQIKCDLEQYLWLQEIKRGNKRNFALDSSEPLA